MIFFCNALKLLKMNQMQTEMKLFSALHRHY